jgi:hypothetical protein
MRAQTPRYGHVPRLFGGFANIETFPHSERIVGT